MEVVKAFLKAHRAGNMTPELAQAAGLELNMVRARNLTQATWEKKVLENALIEEANMRLRAEKAAAQAAETAARDARVEARADVDAWIHAAKETEEAVLGYALRRALATVEAWPNVLADYQSKLAKSPVYTLSWSGQFMEQAADFQVASWLVEGFKVGALLQDLTAEALRETLRAAKGSSRSTSVMSNLVDDCLGQAWAKCYERLTGKW